MEKSIVLESVMKEFRALAAIPRPSGHEKAVSDYLLAHLREMGLEVVQDARQGECSARHFAGAHGYGLCCRSWCFV